MRAAILAAAFLLIAFLGARDAAAQEPAAKPAEAAAPDPPPHIAYLDKEKTIYVTDFAAAGDSPAPIAPPNSGPIDPGSIGSPRPNASDVDAPPLANAGANRVLSDDLLRGFKKAGYKVKYLGPRDPIPEDGILVSGAFTQTGKDGVLRLISPGPGPAGADVQLYVTTGNLLRTRRALYEPIDKNANSAGAPIRLNPEVARLKFSVPANPDPKAVKKVAEQIVAELQRLTLQAAAQGLSGSGDPINQYAKP
ncbi:MAG TPA: hypothetical protein VGD60_15085 [Candidatus Acidoferrales bacterium]